MAFADRRPLSRQRRKSQLIIETKNTITADDDDTPQTHSPPRAARLPTPPKTDDDVPHIHSPPREARQAARLPTRPKLMPAPPLLRLSSQPSVASPSLYSPQKKRPRYQSEDLHTKAHRFSIPVTVSLTRNNATERREVQVVVNVQYFKKSAAPLVFIVELRRLMFWALLMIACTSTGAFRVMPRAVTPQMTITPRASPAAAPLNHEFVEGIAKMPSPISHISRPLIDEMSGQLGKASADFGADGNIVYSVATQLSSLIADGEISVEKMKVAFSRACVSALLHKVVGTGVTLASCMAHTIYQ